MSSTNHANNPQSESAEEFQHSVMEQEQLATVENTQILVVQGQPTQALFTQGSPAQHEPTRAETVQDNNIPDENSSDSEDQELTIRQRLHRLLILFRIAYSLHPIPSILTTTFSVFAFLVFYPVLDSFRMLICLSDWSSRGIKRRAEILMNVFIFVFMICGAFNLAISSAFSTSLIDMVNHQQVALTVTPQKEMEAVESLGNKLARGSENKRMEQAQYTLREIELKNEDVMGFYDKETTKMNNEMLQLQQRFDKVEDLYKRYFHEQRTLSQSNTPSLNKLLLKNVLKGIDDGKLHRIMDKAISNDRNDNDIKLPYYTLASHIVRIICSLTSLSTMTTTVQFDSPRRYLGFDVKNSNLKQAALEPTTGIGHCWTMLGNIGRIKVKAITLEFLIQFLVQYFSSVHKDLQVFGVKNI